MEADTEINIIELSSELASEMVEREFAENPSRFDNRIYIEEDDVISYTEKAQDVFNKWYDHYYTIVEKCKLK